MGGLTVKTEVLPGFCKIECSDGRGGLAGLKSTMAALNCRLQLIRAKIFKRWNMQQPLSGGPTKLLQLTTNRNVNQCRVLQIISLIFSSHSAHWAFYYIMVHKKSKNLKNGHFLQSRTRIVLIEIKFVKCWHIGGWCAPVCLIDTLKNLVFYSKVTINGGAKQVSKKFNLCRFSSSMTVFIYWGPIFTS